MKQRIKSKRSHWINTVIFALGMAHALMPLSARASHIDAATKARLAEEYPRCDGSISQRGENVPVNTSDAAHEVVHAFSVGIGHKIVALVYQDRNNTRWFEGKGRGVSASDVDLAARTFGITDVLSFPSRTFDVQTTGLIDASAIKGRRLIIHGCF